MSDLDGQRGGQFGVGIAAGFFWAFTLFIYVTYGYHWLVWVFVAIAALLTKAGYDQAKLGD